MKQFDNKSYDEKLRGLEDLRLQLNRPAEEQRRRAMSELGSGQSLFADDMPKDIGRIMKVDTLRWDANPPSLWNKLTKTLIVVLVVGVIAVPIAYLGAKSALAFWGVISVVSLVVFFSVLGFWKNPIGTDYFVGDLGCSIVNFKGRRRVLDSRWTYHYRDYNVFLLTEEWQGIGTDGQAYNGTLFESGFFYLRFGHPNELCRSEGYDLGTHWRRYDNGVVPEPQFYFWSGVEERWTDWLMDMLGDDLRKMERQTFYEFRQPADMTGQKQPRASRQYRVMPSISLDASQLIVGDRILTHEDVSYISREIGVGFYVLVIHTTDGERLRVSISHLGNRLLLLRLLEKWQGTPVRYER